MATSAVGDRFDALSSDRGNQPAVLDLSDRRTLTFDDLAADRSLIRRALIDLGLHEGATIVSVVGNRPVFLPILVACMDAGHALVPVGDATDAEVAGLVDAASGTALFTDRDLPLPFTAERQVSGVRLLRLPEPVHPIRHGASVVLKLTSGSTDAPRAAVASEAHLMNDGSQIIEAMGIGRDDINLGCIPLSHSYAIGNLVMPLLLQGTVLALRPSFSPGRFVTDCGASQASVFAGVPFMFEHLKSFERLDRIPDSLRLLITAGARINPETVQWFKHQLGRKVHSFYGSSETGGISYDDSDEVAEPLHVGRPMPRTEVVIYEADDGRAGRVFVRGPAVAYGYASGNGRGSGDQFRDGGFLTSDLGHFDNNRQLVLTGRAHDLVNVAGRKVDPTEVERALTSMSGIADARVIGVACEKRGQEVVAFIVRDDSSLTPIAIRRLCVGKLSAHKIPRRFVFLEHWPVDSRGKIDRQALEHLAASPPGAPEAVRL